MVVNMGLILMGIDFGSWSFEWLEVLKAVLIVGEGVYVYEVGVAWYLFDQCYGILFMMLEINEFGWVDLIDFNMIIMVNGSYGSIS